MDVRKAREMVKSIFDEKLKEKEDEAHCPKNTLELKMNKGRAGRLDALNQLCTLNVNAV